MDNLIIKWDYLLTSYRKDIKKETTGLYDITTWPTLSLFMVSTDNVSCMNEFFYSLIKKLEECIYDVTFVFINEFM